MPSFELALAGFAMGATTSSVSSCVTGSTAFDFCSVDNETFVFSLSIFAMHLLAR